MSYLTEEIMRLPCTEAGAEPSQRVFAAQFLEAGPVLMVPAGRYDPDRQIYVRDEDGKPAFIGQLHLTTHHSTNVSDVIFQDPDNG